jgi:hypothetical protein
VVTKIIKIAPIEAKTKTFIKVNLNEKTSSKVSSFKITKEELLDRLCSWNLSLLDFYESFEEFGQPLPSEIRKRGRPKKLGSIK